MGFIEARRAAQGNSFRRVDLFVWLPGLPGIFLARCNLFAAPAVLKNRSRRVNGHGWLIFVPPTSNFRPDDMAVPQANYSNSSVWCNSASVL
jgi:hypothetical protein